jgi:hypothetical protein
VVKLPGVVGKLPGVVGKLPGVVGKLPGGNMLQYKTVIGPADKIDADVNHLAKEGWIVQTSFVAGALAIGEIDEDGFADMEMPILAYLMVKDTPEEFNDNGRPERKVLGRVQ